MGSVRTLARLNIFTRYWVAFVFYSFMIVLGAEDILAPTRDINVDQFLDLHSSYNRFNLKKRFNLTTLAYVTPWNKNGYSIAETFATKFDILSPVWFQVFGKKKSFAVAGSHQVDKTWIKNVKADNPTIKLLPRFIFEDWRAVDFEETFTDMQSADLCIANILKVLKSHNFDGAVIELWSQFFGSSERNLLSFVVRLSQTLRNNELMTILVIPPPVHHDNIPGRFVEKHFDSLFKHVDFFSLMTYDYSSASSPGPNSPIDWLTKCIRLLVPDDSNDLAEKRAKILTGFNFYGMHYVPERHMGEPILGNQFVQLVNLTRSEFLWNNEAAEHYLRFRDHEGREHLVYYPTPLSIARRLSLINQLGTGMSIWEIGQGLEYFYNQF